MSRSRSVTLVGAAVIVVSALVPSAWGAHPDNHIRPGVTELVSVASDGTQANASSGGPCVAGGPSVSDDGRFVAFDSFASNLDPRDVNRGVLPDVYLRDRKTGKTSLVSVGSTGLGLPLPEGITAALGECLPSGDVIAPLGSYQPAISGNGRFIAFTSAGPSLVGDDANVLARVYLYDRIKRTTELISRSKDSGPGTPRSATGSSWYPSISQDGRYVMFSSTANDLVDQEVCTPLLPTGGCSWHLYRFDRRSETMQLLSVTSDGEPSPTGMRHPSDSGYSISDDGRFAVYVTDSDLTPNDRNTCPYNTILPTLGCYDVYIYDAKQKKVELVSVGRNGLSSNAMSWINRWQHQAVSEDGRFVVFKSDSLDLVPSSGIQGSVYVRDRKTGRTEQMSIASTGEDLSGYGESISDDGRFVVSFAISGNSAGVIFGDASGEWEASDKGLTSATVRHDRRTGQTDMLILQNHQGEFQEDAQGWPPSISGSGRHLVWFGLGDAGLKDENEDDDVYVRDLGSVADLGTGFLPAPSKGSSASAARSGGGVTTFVDAPRDGLGGIAGAEILEARVVHRPSLGDLYLRVDVEHMTVAGVSPVMIGDPTVLYGVRFRSHGARYEVRMGGGLTPHFGLFRCDRDWACTEDRTLVGGFGTAGEAVVTTVPLDAISDGRRMNIDGLTVFSGLGSYATGTGVLLDEVR